VNSLKANAYTLYTGDIPEEYADCVRRASVVAWDIETSGLDWRTDRIGTCQLYVPDGPAAIVRIDDSPAAAMQGLLSDSSIRKIFHHAMFDLRFMVHNWKARPKNIACTKIAAKILDRDNKKPNGLQALLKRFLSIEIVKNEQRSDWLAPQLSQSQIAYALADVLYLPKLLTAIEDRLASQGLLELAHGCFAHIPTRVELDLVGYEDIYTY